MIARAVRVGRLTSYGAYSNIRVEIEAVIEPGETPEQVVERLNDWVQSEVRRLIEKEQGLSETDTGAR